MNTNDFKPLPISIPDIFKMQQELKFQFEPKAKDDFLNFDIDTYESQEVIKKYAWRITEELVEMLEAFYMDAKPGEKEHVYEEGIDAFNFFIELLCLMGTSPDSNFLSLRPEDFHYVEDIADPEEAAHDIIFNLGMFCNLLKSREWRRSQYLVDLYKLWPRVGMIWGSFMKLFSTFGWTTQVLCDWYSLKYQVNKFRLETSY